MKVAIIDYGAGNIESVRNALLAAGARATVARDPEAVLAADRLVLPGVGAAGPAAERLERSGLSEAMVDAVRRKGRPMLGICLGMELLAEQLLEFGRTPGLGWLAGEVVHLRDAGVRRARVPHVGWNTAEPIGEVRRFFEAPERMRTFYFCHSYTLVLRDEGAVAARTEYETPLVAAVLDGTVFATQFHPEKSQINGQRLLRAFLTWAP
ncbi:MAG: imidazole glycerol phosphate synthase subunit HisH [Deltaproteobacteria bacterium]|nr:imidazole glycerol phosphate synthase subunit HisH [Deltaproteobacteria bacterium]